MKVLRTGPAEILGVAKRWHEQYSNGGKWGSTFYGDTEPVYRQLLALTADSTPADVARIIGHDGWTGYNCNECGERVLTAIHVGEEPDYESATVYLCLMCAARVGEIARAEMATK